MQEFRADALVESDAARHFLNVGAHRLAQVGDLVDEGDLHREIGVGRIFDQFGGAARRVEDRRGVEVERPIDLRHAAPRALVVDADDDAVGPLEVADRSALAQEFGIGNDGEIGHRVGFADDPLDLVAGADRHRRFGYDHCEAAHGLGDLPGGGIDVAEVGKAVAAARRRADREEDHLGVLHRRLKVGFEAEPAPPEVGRYEFTEPRLENGNTTASRKRSDLLLVIVDADDLMAEIGETGRGNQADIAGANHQYAHCLPFLSGVPPPDESA